jgi:DNA-binding Lrp family transcriptional regulator
VPDTRPEDVVTALHAFGLARDALRAALARRLGLATADLDALEHLELAGALSHRDLAERLSLTSGAVTQLVDRLERAGLVARQAHDTDRRVSLVRLTSNTDLPPVPAMERYHQALANAAGALSATERRRLTAFLDGLSEAARDTARDLRRPSGEQTGGRSAS